VAVCAATRKDGRPCTNTILPPGASHCFAHDASLQAERAEARKRGGASRSNLSRFARLTPLSLAPITARLEQAIDEVHRGELDPRAASAMAALARALVATVTAGEMEQRLRQLEERSA
jgi:hypothetical protein